ncbi:hypothetical protein HUG10_03475 [Halorarum halophilum]|uniref:Uncharacterized protein n=1 Tax=Halorarum halophilum TaxID=2743090 RepID=A0A7D5KWH8_9EURY|nr:hypothetical protein [Halobaculum halophilum]QLG26658.1 hypothetical protein HUG10_03475 [Halobaculum halophilum]
MYDTAHQTRRSDEPTTSTDADGPTYNPYDGDPPRCHRQCKDGSVCDRLVPLAGVACHHHMGQDRISSNVVADD